jgi:unsaturated rhamnogalacturonyl hydrolase
MILIKNKPNFTRITLFVKPISMKLTIVFTLVAFSLSAQTEKSLSVHREDIKRVLGKVLTYVDKATPYQIVNRTSGKPITNLATPEKEATLKKGDHRIITHEWGVVYSGMLLAGEVFHDTAFTNYVVNRFQFLSEAVPYFAAYAKMFPQEENPMRIVVDPHSLDDSGSLCHAMIKGMRKGIQADLRPIVDNYINFIMLKAYRLGDGTFARNSPRPNTVWTDDLYQSLPALMQVGKLTGEQKYFDEAVKQVRQYSSRVFNKEKGIFVHGKVEGMEHPVFYWARVNGWALLALTEILDELPENHSGRGAMLELYRAHVQGLVATQSHQGLWHQLLDKPDSFLETSASAMFTYSIAHGIRKGWIDKKYVPVALSGWNAVSKKINDQGVVEGTSAGTSISFEEAFYYNRPVGAGSHGYGPVMLAGSEVYTLLEK